MRLSPFFPHGGIPVPFTAGVSGASVEGNWQALKVFTHADVDPVKLAVTSMSGLKRTVRRFGPDDHPLDVIAIDNLPSLLPRESSESFSAELTPLLPDLADRSGPWAASLEWFRRHVHQG